MIDDKLFEERMLEVINSLTEEEKLEEQGGGITSPAQKSKQRRDRSERPVADTGVEADNTGNIPPPGGEDTTGGSAEPPSGEPAATNTSPGEELKPNYNFSYLDTRTMFYKPLPAGGDAWKQSRKSFHKPLIRGVVTKELRVFLEKQSDKRLKYLEELRTEVAKYSDYQFRFRMGTKFKMDATVEFIITKETVKAKLVEIKANTPFQRKDAVFNESDLSKLPILELKGVDSYELYRKIKATTGEDSDRKDIDRGKSKIELGKIVDKIERSSDIDEETKEHAKEITKKIIDTLRHSEKYDVHFDPKKDYSEIIKVAQKAVEDNLSADDEEIEKLIAEKFYSKKKANEAYKVDLNSYLKKVLISEASSRSKEKKNIKNMSTDELKKEAGGDLAIKLDKNIHKWFDHRNGITAYGDQIRFEGKLFKFYEANKVNFQPQERTIDIKQRGGDKTYLRLGGYIEAIGHTWIDARIGEKRVKFKETIPQPKINSWTFRILDAPEKPFFGVSVSTAGKGHGLGGARGREDFYKKDGEGANFGYKDTNKEQAT